MHATRVLNVLVVALSTFSAAQAILIDPAFVQTHNVNDIAKRQKSGGTTHQPTGQATNGDATTATPPSSSSSSVPTSSEFSSSSVVSTTSTTSEQSSSTRPSDTPSQTPTRTPPPTQTQQSQSSSTTSDPGETTSTTETTFASSQTTKLTTMTTVVTSTDSAGKSTTFTSEQVSTTTPDLVGSQSSGNQTGITPQTRNTIIGVVVGVGGAIVLAGVAFLAFRLYRKRQPEEDTGLMDYNSGYTAAEKSDVASSAPSQAGRTPFQSTLESYHAPAQVNPASNF